MPKMEENPYKRAHDRFTRGLHTRENLAAALAPANVVDSLPASLARSLDLLTALSHGVSWVSGWHHSPTTGQPLERNVGEMLMLMVSEISEAMEGHRKGLMDDKLPRRLAVEVELADALHRIFDFAGRHGLDLGGAYVEKAIFNLTRADHKPENRAAPGGKAY